MGEAITLVIELLFALVFGDAVLRAIRRHDRLAFDVALVFSGLTALFVVDLFRRTVGGPPAELTIVAIALLLAQPLFMLRLAARLGKLPRWVMPAGVVSYLATTVPWIALGTAAPRNLTLALVGVFVIFELAAAWFLFAAARRRRGSPRTRLAIAAFATVAFAIAILAAGAGAAASAEATVVARVIALIAALGYVIAFLPPAWLRHVWQATTAFGYAERLLAAPAGESLDALWARLASGAEEITGSTAVVIERDGSGRSRVVASSSPQIELGTHFPPGALEALLGAGRRGDILPRVDAIAADLAARMAVDRIAVVPVPTAQRPAGLVLIERRPSIFLDDDLALLAALASRTAVLVERRAAYGELESLVEALAAASQAKSDFLASMSHELRTPLNAIIGFSDLMRGEPRSDDTITVPAEWVEHISRSGQHLLGLINDVLDLSKVEAGRLELHREPLELTTAVAESIAGLRPLADRKAIRLVADVQPATIDADRGRFRQILYNLLSNAIKFTPDGGRVSVESRIEDGLVRVTVSDTGVGISPEDLPHVFDEFRQVGDPSLRQAGTGLGLALTRRFVEAHDGRVEVESTPGVGSRFTVLLPLAAPSSAAPPVPSGGEGLPSVARTGRDVLVVEDDPSAARLLRAYLEADGYAVRLATDGETALAEARRRPPSAIVLDVLLPTIDGWDVLRLLKADDTLRDVPVIMVTVVDEREVGLALGAVDYFLKPVSREALLSRLARYTFTTKVKNGPIRVLAVDDDPSALTLVEDVLGAEGFTVRRASSGSAALEIAAREKFDLVVCDLIMPEVDGFAVVAALKADERTRDVPILILTAHELDNENKARLNGHILGVVAKGETAVSGLRAWLSRAVPNGRSSP